MGADFKFVKSHIQKFLILIHVIAPTLCFGQGLTNIVIGNSPNNEDGDTPRAAYQKINANENFLLGNGGGGGTNTFTGTNFVATISVMGTNITFTGSNSASGGSAISNALVLVTIGAGNAYIQPGTAYLGASAGGVAINVGAGFFDVSSMGTKSLTTNATFLGAGKYSTLILSSNNDQGLMPIQPGKQYVEMGNFASCGALEPAGNNLANGRGSRFHDIAFLPVNNYGGSTNRAIDCVYYSGRANFSNLWERISGQSSFDTINANPPSATQNYNGAIAVFRDSEFRAVCDTNTVSWTQRAAAITGGSNLTYFFDNTTLYAEQINTNSAFITQQFSTNDCSSIEFDACQNCKMVFVNGCRAISTSTTTNPFCVNFFNATNCTVYLTPDTLIDLTKTNWQGQGNAIVWMTPPGITNYWLDGTNYFAVTLPITGITNQILFSVVSNFTPNTTMVVSNFWPFNIELTGVIGLTAGNSANGGCSAAITLTNSIGGFVTNDNLSFSGQGIGTNGMNTLYTKVLSHGDWVSFQKTVTTGSAASAIGFNNFQMIRVP